jgi:hypothetical protein
MKVYQNFLPDVVVNNLEKLMFEYNMFPWYFAPSSTYSNDELASEQNTDYTISTGEFIFDRPQFYNNLLVTRDKNKVHTQQLVSFHTLLKFLTTEFNVGLRELFRAKANLQLPDFRMGFNIPHADYKDSSHKTFLYYVKDSDGDTIFFKQRSGDGKVLDIDSRIRPTRGTAILFDSNILHSSSPPLFSKARIVINFVFKPL